jgi:hypothetical protein
MGSKNPSNDLAADILLHGGYDPCSKYPSDSSFWAKHIGCDTGFIPASESGYCYMILPSKENYQDGNKICQSNYDAELLSFDTNSEVNGFLKILTVDKLQAKGKFTS